MTLSAAASFFLSTPASLFTLLFVSASASFLLRARAPALAPAPPFPRNKRVTTLLT